MLCTKCSTDLICHHSIDALDVNHTIHSDTHIVSYFICPQCERQYIEEVSMDDKIIYQGELLTNF